MILAKEQPKRVTIICSNDTLGTLQPCGCGGNNRGGLSRRATYIKKVFSENPNTIVVESGDLAFAVNPDKPTAQIEAVADAMAHMGYTAVGVGPVDLRLGDKYFEVLKQKGITVVHVGLEDQEGVPSYIIKEGGGVKIGIVSFGAVAVESRDDFTLMKRRYEALAEADRQSDVLILLDQGNVATNDWLQRNVERLGVPDVLVGGPVRMPLSEAKWVGKTLVVPTTSQGSFIGRVEVEIDGSEKRLTYTSVSIDPSLEEDPDVLKIVQDYVKEQSLSVKSTHISTNDPPQPYFPYQSCVSCHTNEFTHWKTTRHSKALATLLKEDKAIPECLPCHSDMYRRAKRVVVNSEQLGGVECIACHVDVLPHGADFKKKVDSAKIQSQCITCHTKERSESFNMETYYEVIKHTSK